MKSKDYMQISLYYLLLLPTIVVLVSVLMAVPLLVSNEVSLENNPFLVGIKDVFPERIEHIRYILAISVVPMVFTFLAMFFHRKLERLTTNFHSLFFFDALLVQLGLFCFIVYNGSVGNFLGDISLSPFQMSFFIAGIILISSFVLIYYHLLAYARFKDLPISKVLEKKTFKWIAYLIVIIYVLLRLLPSIGFNTSSSGDNGSHEMVYMSEFSPILYGHTMLVDFFPQYQNLQAYLLVPFFSVAGFSYATFSLSMAAIIFISTMLMYQVFRTITAHTWSALLLFIPFISVIFFPAMDAGNGKLYGTYTLASIGAVRNCGWMLITFMLVKTLQQTYNYKNLALLFVIGSLVAINNLDFGIPSLFASLIAILITAEKSFLPSLSTSLKIGSVFLIALLGTIGLFIDFTFLRSGEFPDLQSIFLYQSIFAYYGFGMIPMPNWGLQWVIYITYMATILVAVYKKFNLETLDVQEKLSIGLLIFSGISGCGVSMYYVGRSHPHVMTNIFTAWSFALLLLMWEQFNDWKNHWQQFAKQDYYIRYVPTLLLIVAYIGFLGNVWNTPSMFIQLNRILASADNFYLQMIENGATFIKEHIKPSEKVTIISTIGHEIAGAASVFNVFPYARSDVSFMLKDQFDTAVMEINQHHVKKIFIHNNNGAPNEFMSKIYNNNDFCPNDTFNAEWEYLTLGDCENVPHDNTQYDFIAKSYMAKAENFLNNIRINRQGDVAKKLIINGDRILSNGKALFLHPTTQIAKLAYTDIPVKGNELLLFDVYLKNTGNGVKYSVLINGKSVFDKVYPVATLEHVNIPLDKYRDQKINVDFIVDPIEGNYASDWAFLVNPVIRYEKVDASK